MQNRCCKGSHQYPAIHSSTQAVGRSRSPGQHHALLLPPTPHPPQAYFILDEMLLAGELQETSKRAVGRVIEAQDQLVEQVKAGNIMGSDANFSGPRG